MTKGNFEFQNKLSIGDTMAQNLKENVENLRKDSLREKFSDFENVEHRLEFVANVHGIEYINDSKATNVNSTWYALERMKRETIWIVGGVDKTIDYSSLQALSKEKVRAIVYIGTNKSKIFENFLDKVDMIVDAGSMEEAVQMAYYIADKGETVLLSPASASFNMFENLEERGNAFKQAVRSL
jgi:UDP-N-acetylmuramoylalanine--D-glutamate ligase|tara:strand:- start:431 stop:979 length:549 start_codon:yes stop_codon:yes gene_type:complete